MCSDSIRYVARGIDPDDIHWHTRRDGCLVRVEPDGDVMYRTVALPGLWLDPSAWHVEDLQRLGEAVERDLASPEHAAFVARLATPAT